ncbi:MAG: DUF1971 domain-containing protein [Sneathiella sp.]|uniref:DUF1971 domain-containing protein n=1 Tax=Sneathiella sp. TaxID=1964365 RepID=UPI0030034D77
MADPFQHLTKYSETPVFTEKTVPNSLQAAHETKPGVWGKLCVLTGGLNFVLEAPVPVATSLQPGNHAIIEPTVRHHVQVTQPVTFKVEFYRG